MEFEFTTTTESSTQILKTWNIRLLESIAHSPQQLNGITCSNEAKKKKGKSMSSKSFRYSRQISAPQHDSDMIRRAESFSKLMTYRTDIGGHATKLSPTTSSAMATRTSQGGLLIGGLPPLPHEAKVRSWGGPDDQYGPGGGSLSQDSFARGLIGGSPPPLPPRPCNRLHGRSSYVDDGDEDPDYAYIKEDEIKGPRKSPPTVCKAHSSSSVDDVLNELERDIIRENKAKKLEEEDRKRRARSLGRPQARLQKDRSPKTLRLGPPVTFATAEPQDYTDFVPSKIRQVKSSSFEPENPPTPAVAHTRSSSEPEPHPFRLHSNTLSQPSLLKNDNDPTRSIALPLRKSHTPPTISQSACLPSNFPSSAHFSNRPLSERTMFGMGGTIPSLPPRTWRNTSSGNLEGENSSESPTSASPSSPAVCGSQVMGDGGSESQSHTLQLAEKLKVHGKDPSPSHSPTAIGETHTPVANTHTNQSASSATTPSPTSTTDTTQGHLSTPPPIPPRSPTKEHLSRKSSSSSTSSTSSSARCPHCRVSHNKPKAMVGKTVSLGAALGGNQCPDDCRKSLPNLAGAKSTVENGLGAGRHRYGLRSRHCSRCSPASSTDVIHGGVDNASPPSLYSSSATTFEYMQLVGEEHCPTSAAESEQKSMDLLSSCLKKLEHTEASNKTTSSGSVGAGGNGGVVFSTPISSGTISSSSGTFSPSTSMTAKAGVGSKFMFQPASSSRVTAHTGSPGNRNSNNTADLKRCMESEYTRAWRDTQTQLTLAGLSQPLPQTHHGVGVGCSTGTGSHSSSSQIYDKMASPTTPNERTAHRRTSSSSMVGKVTTKGHHTNGILPQRSSTVLGLAHNLSSPPPTVPPRSMVSLMQQPPMTTPTNKHQELSSSQPNLCKTAFARSHTYGKKSTFTGQMYHRPPAHRSCSLARRQTNLESPGQSSTVFIHHLKDRRVGGLTHLV